MERRDLHELQYITPVANLPSIVTHGIVSFNRARRLPHESVAMAEVQDRRATVMVPAGADKPRGTPLHDYVNLYICARNPMLYHLVRRGEDVCALQVRTAVLDMPGVMIADRNASSGYAHFAAAPAGLAIVDQALTFAEYWKLEDQIEEWERKSRKCAEVLVPHRVDPGHFLGVRASGSVAEDTIRRTGIGLPVAIDSYLFFDRARM